MNYINRITFDKLRMQFDILKMRSAYIEAEKMIIQQAASGNDITGTQIIQSFEPMSPEEFDQYAIDGFGNIRHKSPKEVILNKMNALEEQGRKLLKEEKYELFAELKEIYDRYKQEYDRL